MQIIVNTMSGERYYGTVHLTPEQLNIRMDCKESFDLHEVYQIVTLSVPLGMGQVTRVTKMANPDFANQFVPLMRVLASSWYEPVEDSKENIDRELLEAKVRYEQAVEEQRMHESNLTRVERSPIQRPSGLYVPDIRK